MNLGADISWARHLVALVGGLLAGYIDAIAGGGGLITVPTLLAVGLPPHLALGTNKLQSTLGVATALIRYRAVKLVRIRDWRRAVFFTAVGAALGNLVLQRVSPAALGWLIPGLLAAILVHTLATPALGERPSRERVRPAVFQPAAGTVLGFHDGFFGPGTGAFWAMSLVSLAGLDLRRATAATKVMNVTSNLTALVLFATQGTVVLTVGLAMGAGQIVGSILGSQQVVRRSPRFVRWFLVATVSATAVRLLWVQLRC
jgi:uncharacterized membrane protein YfcA